MSFSFVKLEFTSLLEFRHPLDQHIKYLRSKGLFNVPVFSGHPCLAMLKHVIYTFYHLPALQRLNQIVAGRHQFLVFSDSN